MGEVSDTKTFNDWADLQRKIAVFESGKTARKGKSILAKLRE